MGICAIMLASSLTIMVGSAITSALPDLAVRYHIPVSMSSWLVTVPALGVVASAFLFGKLIDRKGARFTCSVGLLCYGLLGMLGILMPDVYSLLIDRFLLGVATAAVMTSSTALISDFYEGHKRLRMVATQGMAIEVGGIIFLSMGGFLAELSWQGPFFIYAIAFVAWLWLHYFVTSVPVKGSNADAEAQEGAAKHPGSVRPVILLSFLAMLIFFSGIVALPALLQVTLGFSKSFTGNFLAFISLSAVITAGVMPRITKAITAKGSLSVAFCCHAAAFMLFATLNDLPCMILAALLMGAGFGLTIPLLNHLTVERSRAEERGRNLGLYSMATFGGQFISSLTTTFVSGATSFFIVAGLAVVALLLVLFIRTN